MFLKIYLDIPNDNTPINTRGHKLSGTCFSSTVDLHLTAKRAKQLFKTTQEKSIQKNRVTISSTYHTV